MANMTNIDWEKYAGWDLPVYLNRLNPIPLDKTSVFESLEAAQSYAADESKMAYAGQIIAVVDVANSGVTTYKINTDRSLTALATADNIHAEGKMVWVVRSGSTYSETDEYGNPVTEDTPGALYVLRITLGESISYVADIVDLTDYLKKAEAANIYVTQAKLFNLDSSAGEYGNLVIFDEDTE